MSRLAEVRRGSFGDHKSLGEGLFELKVKYGPGYRLYYLHVDNRVIMLVIGGDKSSQARDIRKARACAREYWSSQ